MFIILGLGNPGREYEKTRHNTGYLALDTLADRHDIDIARHGFRSVFGEGYIGAKKVVLAKPETYMNNSGFAARDLVNWYKIEDSELIVVYDDVDLPVGDIRIRANGSSGTHNGMKSVIYQLGFDDFPRVRIGIGAPEGERDMIAHVLGSPMGEDIERMNTALKLASDAIELIVAGDIAEAQARFNKHKKKAKAVKLEEAENGADTEGGDAKGSV